LEPEARLQPKDLGSLLVLNLGNRLTHRPVPTHGLAHQGLRLFLLFALAVEVLVLQLVAVLAVAEAAHLRTKTTSP
jgi:hypothetical protein